MYLFHWLVAYKSKSRNTALLMYQLLLVPVEAVSGRNVKFRI